MSDTIETDYLIVGAGAAGMAIADALLTHSDASITMVDRRHAPGGHWLDAYPYVRLHQPSAFYGVSSVPLGQDAIDTQGHNAGFYELANADEIRAYFSRVMAQHLLPSGRVTYLPSCDHLGAGQVRSRLADRAWDVRVRRKTIDTTYLEGQVPATSPPPFEVASGVRCVAAGELTHLTERPERYVVIGAGKTAVDACLWLLDQGVPPASIRWVKPRESWWLNRRFHQPLSLLPDFLNGTATQLQAIAEASSVPDLFARLEAQGFFLRIDTEVPATMCRGAIVSEAELAQLRQIKDVVRLGHVRRIDANEIVLDGGRVPTSGATVHVHCAARGLPRPPLRPIFEADRITVQPFMWSFACFQFALLGVAEAVVPSDEDKNRLFPPMAYWDANADYLGTFLAALANEQARATVPALAKWAKTTRLNPLGQIGQHREHPLVADAMERIKRFGPDAFKNGRQLLRAQRA